jgi:RNA polymerase sigma factor (sigma-70 family)
MTELDRHQLGPLLDRVTAGDRAALNELFARLRPYLHALVRRTLGDDWKDASDIVQSSLRRINEHLDDLLADDPTVPHLLAWIKKIVRNRAIDEARRRAHRPTPTDESALRDLPGGWGRNAPNAVEAPAQQAEREQRSLRLLSVLGKLPERQRLVVEMHYFDRLRDEEIRQRIGGSIAAIRVLRCRALKELRRLMEANDAAE